MNVSPLQQLLGNSFVGLATLIFLLPLRKLMHEYAGKNLNNDSWTAPALFILTPHWLLLMGALLCVTASGGFDGLSLGRPALYGLTAAATLALGTVSFLFIALYIRPGFTPRALYIPVIYLVPLATATLVVLSLNPALAPGMSTAWLRVPWTIFAGLSLAACTVFLGHRLIRLGVDGMTGIAYRLLQPGPSADAILARLPTLDPQSDFFELLRRTGPGERRAIREAVTARLREHPAFIETLTATLNARDPGYGLGFLYCATLSPEELKALARPARYALESSIHEIPAPNYMPARRRKELLRWGRKTFPVIINKFSGMDVDFSEIMPAFEHALRPDDTRR